MNWGKQTKSELKDGKKLENGKGTKLQTRENIWTFVNTYYEFIYGLEKKIKNNIFIWLAERDCCVMLIINCQSFKICIYQPYIKY
ncbi:hypothetical protein RIR_jg2460.t1 [Rhizophagus irregularis DAOM 181602=DAOM 197198]|nr:hypothetical protein RIR_jg2460.t1 [Rhizophagus irregularis DAOM 181602=DAOM 197198]